VALLFFGASLRCGACLKIDEWGGIMTLPQLVVGAFLAIFVFGLIVSMCEDLSRVTFFNVESIVVLAGLLGFIVYQWFRDATRKPASPDAPNAEVAETAGPKSEHQRRPSIRNSLWGAIFLLFWDGLLEGTYITSLLVCPVWFLVSLVKNAIQRPGWRVALIRIAAPALTLGIVWENNAIQWNIAEANAQRIVKACDEYHAANGKYPHTLDELVPRYLDAVPRAKYCLDHGEFWYWNFSEDNAHLVWWKVPPFGRKIYSFKEHRWGYLD
jgi:hypothetical protein